VNRARARITHESDALLLRRVEYGEADLIVTLFTRALGRIVAIARGARKSRRRFAGALEPFFTIRIRFDERPGAELAVLTHAEIARPRTALLTELARMELSGKALGWIRAAAPPRTPEPLVFERVERLLDRLSELGDRPAELELAEAGLSLLTHFGWSLDFERCVRCGRPCPEGISAFVDVRQGGLVCRACGGARMRLEPQQRARLARAAAGNSDALVPEDAGLALTLIDRVFSAHAGIDGGA
jgi:DNA repair protein RecO (recombination protein O)